MSSPLAIAGVTAVLKDLLNNGLIDRDLSKHVGDVKVSSLPPDRIYTHREIKGGTTDCPGPALTRYVRELRSELRKRLVAYHR